MTVLYDAIDAGTYVEHDVAAGTQALFNWFAGICDTYENISFGFELETKEAELPPAVIHFQPCANLVLVRPFCEAAGELQPAKLYVHAYAKLTDDAR